MDKQSFLVHYAKSKQSFLSDREKAIKTFKDGGVVIFPTDTAFGIGGLMTESATVKRVYKIRNRPKDKAVPVLFSSVKMVKKYVKPFPDDIETLMKEYWPGGLTIILKCKTSKVPSAVRAGGGTIGVRIPNHKALLSIIRKTGPIIAPSANFAGEATPFFYSDIKKELISKSDFVLKGRVSIKKQSTIIDCTRKPFKIIREGAVKISYSPALFRR